MKNKDKYAKKWYERYLTIAIGCTILSISYIIMLMYFLLIKKIFLFPFDSCRRFRTDVVHHSVYTSYFVDNVV